jgi:DnaJ-class molecular chaperone
MEDRPMVTKLRAAFDRLLERLRPEGPCPRCHGTGVWRSLDCPDCGGKGRR